MADFIVRRRRDFVFAVEDAPEKTFTLPGPSSLSFEDAAITEPLNRETDIAKRGEIIKRFVLKFAPGLEALDIGDLDYVEIYNAYILAVGREKLGESTASQDS